MTVLKPADDVLLLEGACPIEDAEILLQHLTGSPSATVDLRNCLSMHTAVIQVLLAAKPALLGPPSADTPHSRWVYPALISHKCADI
jgi:hypothetical protein